MRAILVPFLFLIPVLLQAANFRSVECRFIRLGAGAELTSVVVSPHKGDDITCELPSDAVSAKVKCPATDDVIRFLGAAGGEPVATATLPPGMKSALLVFFQVAEAMKKSEEGEAAEKESEVDAKGAAGKPGSPQPKWQVLVIDDSAGFSGNEGGLVGNCFESEIRYTIGTKQVTVPAMESSRFAMPAEKNDFNMAPVSFEFRDGDDWKMASQSSLRFPPGLRYMLFLYPNVHSGRPYVAVIKELGN